MMPNIASRGTSPPRRDRWAQRSGNCQELCSLPWAPCSQGACLVSQAQRGTGQVQAPTRSQGTATGGRVLRATVPGSGVGSPISSPGSGLFPSAVLSCVLSVPGPPDLICAMFIISVLYFCTEMYWSTLEKLSSCSVVKRTFLDPRTGRPPSACALDQAPRHGDLNWDKCSPTVGRQQEAGLSQAPHSRAAWLVHPFATPRPLLGTARFYL